MTSQIIDAPLSWHGVAPIADGAQVSLSRAALERIAHAKTQVTVIVARRLRCYGVHPGGPAPADVLVDELRRSAVAQRHHVPRLRASVPTYGVDRPFATDIAAAIKFIRETSSP